MSSPSAQPSSISFEDLFFLENQSDLNEQRDNLVSEKPEKKGGRAKVLELIESEDNTTNVTRENEPQSKAVHSLNSLFDDIYASTDDEKEEELISNDFDIDSQTDSIQRTDPLIDMESIAINGSPEPQGQQEQNESSSRITTQLKRHSLRKRSDIQLRPYSLERARYMSLLQRRLKSKSARDRINEYIGSAQSILEQDDIDPDFVPGQSNISTQNESIILETQEPEWDHNVLVLPKPRQKASHIPRSDKRSNDTTARKGDDGKMSKTIVQSLRGKESGSSSHHLQTDPISALPLVMNTKGRHRIIHTYKKRRNIKRGPTEQPANDTADPFRIFDFDPEPRDFFDPNDDGDMDFNDDAHERNEGSSQLSDGEEEMLHLSKKGSKKRRVIISDNEDEDEESDRLLSIGRRATRRKHHKQSLLLEPNSVAQFDDMVNRSSQVQERFNRTHRRRHKSDDDVVPIIQDENELSVNENRRVRLNDITANKRLLHGILPYSFTNIYKSQLQEEQQRNQARKNVPVERRTVVERGSERTRLHTPTGIFNDKDDDDDGGSSQIQQHHLSSSVYTQSQDLDPFAEALESIRTTHHYRRKPTTKTQTRLAFPQTSTQSSAAMEYNRVPSYYHRQNRNISRSTGQTSRKRRRRKIHKTTDDIYIRPSRHYWNDETIDMMFTRQGGRQHHQQKKRRAHDDLSIGPSCFNPTTTSDGIKITWIHNIEDYLNSEKRTDKNSNLIIKALKEREERRLSIVQQQQHYPQQPKQPQNMTVASVLDRVGDLVDPDLRTTVGLPNTVYLHHKLLPSLLSGARNKKKYFDRFKSLLEYPIIYNTRVIWKDIVPEQEMMMKGWFWKAFYDIADAFQNQEQETTISPTFYIFVSICIGRWIPSLPKDMQMEMIEIFHEEARVFADQVYHLTRKKMGQGSFIPWKVVMEAMLFTLDWKCRLIHLGADEGVWPLTELTSNLIHVLVQIGPEQITMETTSYVSEMWICLLQIMSVSTTDAVGYSFSEQVFLGQLEEWVYEKSSKETWTDDFKTQLMKPWAFAFKHIFDKYML